MTIHSSGVQPQPGSAPAPVAAQQMPEAAPADADGEQALALAVAAAVREASRQAAIEAWEDAGVQGLCAEGRIEVAIGAIERLSLASIVRQALAAWRGR